MNRTTITIKNNEFDPSFKIMTGTLHVTISDVIAVFLTLFLTSTSFNDEIILWSIDKELIGC